MKYLYKFEVAPHFGESKKYAIKYDVFTPSMRRWTIPGETIDFKTKLVRFLFWLQTFGKAKIFFIQENEKVVHTSYVVPKCYKFNFLCQNDYEIGPCYTYPQYRGRGIYPDTLCMICQSVGNEDTTFYMIVDEKNNPSIKGIEKAGFVRCGQVRVSKLTKRYCLN